MVLPFMVNGDLKSYLKNKRKSARCVDQFPEVCYRLLIIFICVYVVCVCMHVCVPSPPKLLITNGII